MFGNTAADLIKILEGYKRCDPDRLAAIADHMGIPVELLIGEYLIQNVTEEDIIEVQNAIESTKEEHPEAAPDPIIISLRTAAIDSSSLTTLPNDIYQELARLTSDYSDHYHTRTVYFRANALEIKPEDGCQDSSKDTYEDNGPVAENYLNLIAAIVRIARDEGETNPIFLTLAKLYQCLTTLSSNACNQKNAVEFARSLEEHAPPSHLTGDEQKQEPPQNEVGITQEDSSQNNGETTAASNDQAHNHSNNNDEDSTKKIKIIMN